MTIGASFSTSTGLTGTWPQPPRYWSYSSLTEVRSCPRRYALKRAAYPALSDQPGYPDRVAESSLVGTAIHKGVETVLDALKAARCVALSDEQAVATLRSLGGYSVVAVTASQKALASLEGNPRMTSHVARLRDRLERRTPEMRRAIQTLVSRMSVLPESASGMSAFVSSTAEVRGRLNPGLHPEVALVAHDVRFVGRIDLLAVHIDHADILDLKTGQPAPHHAEQVALYGLLWMLDGLANPDQMPVGSLTLAYVGRDQTVPTPNDWSMVRHSLEEQIESADQALAGEPPDAVPSTECRHCPVRHMCDEYWQSSYAEPDPGSAFVDAEVVVVSQNGPKSWVARLAHSSRDALLRTTTEDASMETGRQLRVLDAVFAEAEDDGWAVITITSSSEVHCLALP